MFKLWKECGGIGFYSNGTTVVLYDPDTLKAAYLQADGCAEESLLTAWFSEQRAAAETKSAKRREKREENLMLRLLLTGRCNLNCSYCQMRKMVNHSQADLDFETIDKILDKVEAEGYAYITIHFSGGEPLLAVKQIEYVCSQVRQRNLKKVRFAISSNGTLMEDAVIDLLLKYDIQTVISIDDLEESSSLRRNYHGLTSVNKVLKQCRKATEQGLKLGISTVFIQSNRDKAVKLIDELHDKYHIESMGYNYQHYSGFEKRHVDVSGGYMQTYADTLVRVSDRCRELNIFEEQSNRIIEPFVTEIPRRNHCSSQVSQVTVLPNGMLGPCKTFASAQKDIVSCEQWIADAQESNAVFDKWRGRNTESVRQCSTCPYRTICGGGCPYEAYVDHQDIYTADERYCVVAQTLFLHMLDYLEQAKVFADAGRKPKLLSKEQKAVLLTCKTPDTLKLTTSIGHYLEN